MNNFTERLAKAAAIAEIDLQPSQLKQFYQYYQLLLEWNEKINLTAITAVDAVIEKHFLDSLLAGKILPLIESKKVIDVGAGAGFPSLPLKIVYNNLDLLLADSLNKRIIFLKEVIARLELCNVKCIHGRAEDLAKEINLREQFDLVVSRAVAHLPVLLEFCLPFVTPGGYFIAYKGPEAELEIMEAKKALTELGGEIQEVKKFNLPISGDWRSLLLINKIRETPVKYPRKAGIPGKNPLV
ncbi:MAG: 16S rRNA (guanine(527)-N(7))-methyltransferase RsmG [Clostridia bacterium]|nr:16S rRNA (guanine(527)-N(7))-methyltransferase RsmG [Clostridia bacterium]